MKSLYGLTCQAQKPLIQKVKKFIKTTRYKKNQFTVDMADDINLKSFTIFKRKTP